MCVALNSTMIGTSGTREDRRGHEHDRTVVITTETQPNFDSTARPLGLPMKDKPGSHCRK